MTSHTELLQCIEHEVFSTRGASERACQAYADLPLESRAAYHRAMRFLGCKLAEGFPGDSHEIAEQDRVKAIRLMLLSLYADTSNPAWSSSMLDRLLKAITATPGGGIGDLLRALYELFGEFGSELTETKGTFITELVIKSFTEYRALYLTSDLSWMVQQTSQCSTPSQAYLTLLAVSPTAFTPECSVAILRKLESTPYWEQALNMLSEILASEKALELLQKWRIEGIAAQSAADIERVLNEV